MVTTRCCECYPPSLQMEDCGLVVLSYIRTLGLGLGLKIGL